MQLRLPFDAALVMNQTTLAQDFPEVWRRYLNNTTIAYGRQTGVRVLTKLGAEDLRCIRSYFCLWLSNQELIDDDLRSRDARQLVWQAQMAVGAIDEALRKAAVLESDPCHR